MTKFNLEAFAENFANYGFQLNVAFETILCITDRFNEPEMPTEVYFRFQGTPLRWINGTGELMPILVVPIASIADGSSERTYELVLKFQSWAISTYRLPIRQSSMVSGPKRLAPILAQTRHTGLLWKPLDIQNLNMGIVRSDKEWAARHLFRDGMNSDSVLYKFFCYFKIILLPFVLVNRNGIEYLDHNKFDAWVAEQYRFSLDVNAEFSSNMGSLTPGGYLRQLRNAIGHVETLSDGTPALSSGNPADTHKLNKALPFVRGLAEEVIRLKCMV